jgi:hypothetical protein
MVDLLSWRQLCGRRKHPFPFLPPRARSSLCPRPWRVRCLAAQPIVSRPSLAYARGRATL